MRIIFEGAIVADRVSICDFSAIGNFRFGNEKNIFVAGWHTIADTLSETTTFIAETSFPFDGISCTQRIIGFFDACNGMEDMGSVVMGSAAFQSVINKELGKGVGTSVLTTGIVTIWIEAQSYWTAVERFRRDRLGHLV